ncbi:MAG TPA: hypothetical protein VK447_13035 [Myxococcaceae bacterium]|nr:hypothetical protein [Myxococcaceae bacterium]
MTPRRRSERAPTEPELPAAAAEDARDEESSVLDLVTSESEEELEGWSRSDRQLFAELLEDAGSELQKELLRRALAAGHPANELHAFADAIRGLADDALFDACTLAPAKAAKRSVEERLLAEADPLYAYELNGGKLSPKQVVKPQKVKLPPGMIVEVPTNPGLPRKGRELGSSADADPVERTQVGAPQRKPKDVPGRFAEDLFNDATRGLGWVYEEQSVDPGLSLELALSRAAEALLAAIPVPVILGAVKGDYRRYALLLQLQFSGQNRVFQLHNPFEHETVWIHEGDFYSGRELPLSDKSLRRITAIALPEMG